MIKSFCDHCGKEIDRSHYVSWNYIYFGVFDGGKFYELCPDCHEKIKCFIENKEENMSENILNKSYKSLWEKMKAEYFRRHPEAGLAWWQVPVDQQPEGFKIEMYEIFWDLTRE